MDIEPRKLPRTAHIAPRTQPRHYLHGWLEKKDIATATRSVYEWAIVGHIIPALGNVKMCDLTRDRISKFYNDLRLGDGGKQKVRRVLHAALADAAAGDNRVLIDNPAANIRLKKNRTPRVVRKWSPDDALRCLRHARETPYFALILLSIVGAAGPAEFFGLRWRYVDLKSGTVAIVGNLVEVGGVLEYKDVKVPSRRRSIALPNVATKALRQLFKKCKPAPDDYVFTAPGGGPIRRTTFGARVWRPLLEEAGVAYITPYGLRHSSASLMAALGIPSLWASRHLGHSNVSTTSDVYTHLFSEIHRAIADRFDELLSRL